MNELNLFKTRSKDPLILKKGQWEIYDAISRKSHSRVSALCHTRYGKSMSVALGIISRMVTFPEKFIIIAPTDEKTDIIMSEIRTHLFDHKLFYSQLPERTFQSLKEKRRQNHITFKSGGEVFCLTANVDNQQAIGKTLLGEGGGNVIIDEAPLINDKIMAFVMRMLADTSDNFLFKIGNAFGNNHFKRSFKDPRYHKIVVDCYRGLEESKGLPYSSGKLTQELLDEMKELPFFEELWECKFPTTALTNEKGWTSILSEDEILASFKLPARTDGACKLGVDVGRGSDPTVFVARWPHYARVLSKNQDPDLMSQIPRIEAYIKEYNIDEYDTYIDDIGVGGGISDRCLEKNICVVKVVAGAKAQNEEKFKNVKAENYFNLAKWVKCNALEENKAFLELVEIRSKEDSEKRFKTEPKDDFRKRMNKSPDEVEALMLTFTPKPAEPDLYLI